jgi:hypothetical protein
MPHSVRLNRSRVQEIRQPLEIKMSVPNKPNYRVGGYFAELDQIRKSLNAAKKGYRLEKYTMLKSCQLMIGKLLDNETDREAFVASIKKDKTKNGQRRNPAEKFDLTLEVVVKASGDRKMSHKYARCLDYLRELKVDMEDTVQAIKKRGGIEATYREYQASKSKRDRTSKDRAQKSLGRPPGPKKRPPFTSRQDKGSVAKGGPVIDAPQKIIRVDNPGLNRAVPGHNDRQVSMMIWMKLSERDRIRESEIGTRWTLSSVRVKEGDGDLKVSTALSIDDAENDFADVN